MLWWWEAVVEPSWGWEMAWEPGQAAWASEAPSPERDWRLEIKAKESQEAWWLPLLEYSELLSRLARMWVQKLSEELPEWLSLRLQQAVKWMLSS